MPGATTEDLFSLLFAADVEEEEEAMEAFLLGLCVFCSAVVEAGDVLEAEEALASDTEPEEEEEAVFLAVVDLVAVESLFRVVV